MIIQLARTNVLELYYVSGDQGGSTSREKRETGERGERARRSLCELVLDLFFRYAADDPILLSRQAQTIFSRSMSQLVDHMIICASDGSDPSCVIVPPST